MQENRFFNAKAVGLIPSTSIQYLDILIGPGTIKKDPGVFYHVYVDEGAYKACELTETETDEEDEYGEKKKVLIDLVSQKIYQKPKDGKPSFKEVAKRFEGMWFPLPFFKLKPSGRSTFYGPTNWVRGQLQAIDDKTFHLVVAVDTKIDIRENADENRKYSMPRSKDIATSSQDSNIKFQMADEGSLLEFAAEDWVSQWVDECYKKSLSGDEKAPSVLLQDDDMRIRRGRRDFLYLLKYLSSPPQKLGEKEKRTLLPKLHFYQTVSKKTKAPHVNVDLILDIGHSRTCGFLLDREKRLQGRKLEIRDMSKPHQVYSEAFESRLEFSNAEFGNTRLSRITGRAGKLEAFVWPSACRVGNEAQRLSYEKQNSFGESGFSDPKRYLWDIRRSPNEWFFSSSDPSFQKKIVTASFPQKLNVNGDWVNAPDNPKLPYVVGRFSRSSMMVYFLGEIIAQAVTQINSHSYRENNDNINYQRYLKNIILTVPSTIPEYELTFFKKRVQSAINVLWDLLEWSKSDGQKVDVFSPPRPKISVMWDEPTCTQATYLYAEIVNKFEGRSEDFLKVLGTKRKVSKEKGEKQTVRIACLDIGGGTTDLAIATYRRIGTSSTLDCTFDFREGVRRGGSEVVRKVIENTVLPGMVRALELHNCKNAFVDVQALLSHDRISDTALASAARKAFATQVAQEIAFHVLEKHENRSDYDGGVIEWVKISDVMEGRKEPSEKARDFLNGVLSSEIDDEFDILNLSIPIDMKSVEQAVKDALLDSVSNLCEAIHRFDCDVLLVTGGASRLPAVQNMIASLYPVPLHRIEFMKGYRVGDWYPYRDKHNLLDDPKTTVVIGAAILHNAIGNTDHMSLEIEKFSIGDGIRHIGVLDRRPSLVDDQIIFDDIDPAGISDAPLEETVELSVPCDIGFQQIRLRRWPSKPFYRLEFKNEKVAEEYSSNVMKATFSLDAISQLVDGDDKVIDLKLELSGIKAVNENVNANLDDFILIPRTITEEQEQRNWQVTGAFEFTRNSQLDNCTAEEMEQFTNA
ncbi:virulence factor SrfB [Terasakiella sp. SH-1]|uniref:virulence factor SrfB n=1 Tax=Terasakiella sp. SH-1 TaxID=2560057 RepID=UPI0014319FF5|nr:virulence factor SrfB [Terasakiella sp. SH-1]